MHRTDNQDTYKKNPKNEIQERIKLRLFLLSPREKNIPLYEINTIFKGGIIMKNLFNKVMNSEMSFVIFMITGVLITLAICIFKG